MQCRNLLMCCVGMWNTKNAGKLPMLLLLVLPLLLPSLQALTLTRHVHWQLRTPLLAAQRLNARVQHCWASELFNTYACRVVTAAAVIDAAM